MALHENYDCTFPANFLAFSDADWSVKWSTLVFFASFFFYSNILSVVLVVVCVGIMYHRNVCVLDKAEPFNPCKLMTTSEIQQKSFLSSQQVIMSAFEYLN